MATIDQRAELLEQAQWMQAYITRAEAHRAAEIADWMAEHDAWFRESMHPTERTTPEWSARQHARLAILVGRAYELFDQETRERS